jgi:SAM-dependent methyltransferase
MIILAMCPNRRAEVDVVNDFDPKTLDFYARGAEAYLAHRPDEVEPYLPEFLNMLASGATVLDLGCGGGRNSEYMIERGFEVDASDGVPEMAALAEARLGRLVKVMRFEGLDVVAQYDAVIASAALHHVPRHRLPKILGRISLALKPGGLHFATYKSGGIDGRDDYGRYYNYPDQAVLEQLYRSGGNWTDMDIQNYTSTGWFSKGGPWLRIIVKKAHHA